jgi:hypothetical protein
MSSSAERKAPPDSTRTPSRAERRKSLQAQSGVTHLEAEEEAQAGTVDAGIRQPESGIGALDAVARDDAGGLALRVGLRQTLQQDAKVGDAELAVPIGEADERVARCPQARTHGGPIAPVHGMVDDAHDPGMLGGKAVGDGRRAVRAAVVDADDLEVFRQRGEGVERLCHEGLEVVLLVVRWKEVAQLSHASDVLVRRGWAGCDRRAGRGERRRDRWAGHDPHRRTWRPFRPEAAQSRRPSTRKSGPADGIPGTGSSS